MFYIPNTTDACVAWPLNHLRLALILASLAMTTLVVVAALIYFKDPSQEDIPSEVEVEYS